MTVAPRTVRATGSPSFDKVSVEYDEVMDSLTVTDAVNYAISPPLGIIERRTRPRWTSRRSRQPIPRLPILSTRSRR